MNPLPVVTRMSFRSLFQGRKLVLPALLGSIPVVMSLLLIWVQSRFEINTLSPGALYRFLATDYYHSLLIFVAILFGTSAVADDEEDGSVVYFMVRPIRRGIVYLGKVAAAALATLATALCSLSATWTVLAVGGGDSGIDASALFKDCAWLGLGAIAYPAAFAAAAAIGKRPLQFAIAYFFLWELPMAFAPTSLRFLTVSHYVLSLMPRMSWWNAAVAAVGKSTPVPLALAGLTALVLALLVLGSAWFERKEHLPNASA